MLLNEPTIVEWSSPNKDKIPVSLKPKCEVVWVITSGSKVETDFGRVVGLR
jgi:hypothetical protein